MTRHEALGWVILVGVPVLLAVVLIAWIISVIPPVAWIFLVLSAGVLIFFCRVPLRDGWAEGKRKNWVQVLKREIDRLEAERSGLKTYGYLRITPAEFKQQLAALERELALARQDLRSIWKLSDGW